MIWTKESLIEFELKIKEMWERGEIKAPVHLSGGNETQLINIFKEIKDGDFKFSSHRNHYHFLLSAGNPQSLIEELLRKPTGICKGESGSMCTTDHNIRFYSSAIVGGMCSVAVGVAWAIKMEQQLGIMSLNTVFKNKLLGGEKVWCFIGDGAVDGGHFWEALQFAEGWDLPITFVIEDNDRSTCSTITDRFGEYPYKLRNWLSGSSKVIQYYYKPTFPHVGSGTYVQF